MVGLGKGWEERGLVYDDLTKDSGSQKQALQQILPCWASKS